MNPYTIIGAGVTASLLFFAGVNVGKKWEEGRNAIEQKHITQAVDAATRTAAQAIATLSPVYTTINAKVRHETTTNTIYRDCTHTTDGLRLINQALNGGEPALRGELPEVDATGK